MSKKTSISIILISFILLQITSLERLEASWDDNPNIDSNPIFQMNIGSHSASPISVVTIEDFDNFDLGVDFAECHISENPLIPGQYFVAFNINGTHYTLNGIDWQRSNPLFPNSAGDPVTAYDSLGKLYYDNMKSPITGTWIVSSTDNGTSWATPVSANVGNDKNWIVADQTNGPYSNYIYGAMTPGNVVRSTDRGATFTTVFSSSNTLPGNMTAVGAFGNVQGGAAYFVKSTGSAFAAVYTFFRSTNGGVNWVQMSSQNFANTVGTQVGGRNSVQNMRTRPYPFIGADNSYNQFRGRLYLVYASNNPVGDGNKPDIFCRYSNDGGATWSNGVIVNDDINTQNHNQWHPAMWVDKTSGKLYIQWMDTRDTPTSDSAFIYATYSTNGGQSFVSNQRISNKKFKINCTQCNGGSPAYLGDYNSIVSNPVTSMVAWADFRNSNFGSYVAYFPDYASKMSATSVTIDNSSFTTFKAVIPEVKLYTENVTFSVTISPTPANGAVTAVFPNGNVLSNYPDSLIIRINAAANTTSGYYTIHILAKGPNGTPVHRRTVDLYIGSVVYNCPTTWKQTIRVNDAGSANDSIKFGMSPSGTNGIDTCLGEVLVPPPPPSGVFDCRFVLPNNDAVKTDIRKDTIQNVNWRMTFQPSISGYPITFSWNPLTLPIIGSFFLKDEITGTIVNVNMRTQTSYTLTNAGISSLKIEYMYNQIQTTSVSSGWNIVSVPLRTQDMLYSALFPSVASPAYTYSNGYVSIAMLSNGTSYWMKFNNSANFNFTGYPWTPENMLVSPGWNLIGPFDNNIPISSIMSNPAGIVTSNYFGYNGGYYNTDTLKVGRGYWIRTTMAGYLYKGGADNTPKEPAVNPLDNFAKLVFSSGEDVNASLYLGNAAQITTDYSMPPVPPSGIYDVRFGTDKLVEALGGNHVLKISSATAETRLRVNNTGGMKFRIKDGIDGSILNKELTEGTEIIIPANLNNLILETSAVIPLTYELGQNYPNPFNPVTTIKYQIPEDGTVKMSVYDVLGKEIKTLVNDFLAAGAYEVRLDASDLSSGIYFYQMRAGHFEEMRKMVVIK
jgi:hypothetical protein